MKEFKEKLIVGIDHGYGNIKTANHCFKTGIMGYDTEPLFTKDMLEYGGRYYLIGEGHKEFLPDKIKDEDYYLLTLVAIAEELKDKGLTEADVITPQDFRSLGQADRKQSLPPTSPKMRRSASPISTRRITSVSPA